MKKAINLTLSLLAGLISFTSVLAQEDDNKPSKEAPVKLSVKINEGQAFLNCKVFEFVPTGNLIYERSVNGKEYVPIFLDETFPAPMTLSYPYVDKQMPQGDVHYRVRYVDHNASEMSTNTVAVKNSVVSDVDPTMVNKGE